MIIIKIVMMISGRCQVCVELCNYGRPKAPAVLSTVRVRMQFVLVFRLLSILVAVVLPVIASRRHRK